MNPTTFLLNLILYILGSEPAAPVSNTVTMATAAASSPAAVVPAPAATTSPAVPVSPLAAVDGASA